MPLFDWKSVLAKFNSNPPAAISAIKRLDHEWGIKLPNDYLEFLKYANGGEGFIGPNAYAILWRVEDLPEMNQAYEVAEYASGLFLFGSDGGGEAFAFDRRSEQMPIVSVPFVGMDTSLVRPVATSFTKFLEELSKQ